MADSNSLDPFFELHAELQSLNLKLEQQAASQQIHKSAERRHEIEMIIMDLPARDVAGAIARMELVKSELLRFYVAKESELVVRVLDNAVRGLLG